MSFRKSVSLEDFVRHAEELCNRILDTTIRGVITTSISEHRGVFGNTRVYYNNIGRILADSRCDNESLRKAFVHYVFCGHEQGEDLALTLEPNRYQPQTHILSQFRDYDSAFAVIDYLCIRVPLQVELIPRLSDALTKDVGVNLKLPHHNSTVIVSGC